MDRHVFGGKSFFKMLRLGLGLLLLYLLLGGPSYYLVMLDIRQVVGLTLVVRLNPLDHRRDVVRLSLSYRYYVGRFSELAELVSLPYSCLKFTHSDRLHNFFCYYS